MIKSWCYDVEVLPNFFSVTIIDLSDYLNIFKDCVNEKGKPIPLIQKYNIDEIKNKLNNIKCYSFYITDKDDSQLLQMLGFINNLRAHYENNVAIRNDMFGYNTNKYDKFMIAGLLMFANQVNNTKELITKLYELSKHIIELQDNPELAKHDYFLETLRKYNLPFVNIDLMTIFALNKVGKGVNAKGETIYFGKGLKQTSINLQWYELLEYSLPDISDKDVHLYQKDARYSNIPADRLNKLIKTWDRYIIDEWVPDMIHYNKNDVFICCEMVRLYIDEVRLRYNITKAYGVDVLSSSRSNIADNLFVKFYSEFSGLSEYQWRGKKTERTALAFKRVIFPFIKFKTKELQNMLDEMKQVVLYSIGKKALKEIAPKYSHLKYLKTNNDSGWFEITLNNLTYTIATGGLHSKDIPRELKSKIVPSTGELIESNNIWDCISDDSYIYCHADVSSFYPSLMSVYRIAPAHLNEGVFVKLITWLKETRVTAKHSKEEYIDGIPKDTLAQVLKIVINSIYGKLGFERGDICDRLAVLKVTINGQLLLLKLCEELELNDIQVMSANTDGIVVKVYKHKKELYDKIIKEWCDYTKLGLDSEEYKAYINRDINNYVIEETNGKLGYKGDLNPFMYAVDLQKGYDMPIVAQAAVNFFLYNKPVLETLYECKSILDFCKTQNVSRKFNVEFTDKESTKMLQRNTRFYVSNTGGKIEKVDSNTKQRFELCAGQKVTILNTLDDKPIELRDINYNYYFKEAIKIIDPIKLNISPSRKSDRKKGVMSGKKAIQKASGFYNSLFDDNDD